jgi:hypothetical protein
VAPGYSVTFNIAGWSTAPVAPWSISADSSDLPASSLKLSTDTIGNGGTATLTVTVPSTMAPGSTAFILLTSARSASDYHVWFAGLRVK